MEDRPIIVKRVKKKGGGHHGGAWKVAFADFAMALMAFFLVMWATNQATPEQKKDISKYFSDPVGYEEGGNPNPVDLGGSPAVVMSSNPTRRISCSSWRNRWRKSRTNSASPAIRTARHLSRPESNTPTGNCRRIVRMRHAGPWFPVVYRRATSVGWWGWPTRCCSTRRSRRPR